MLAYIHMFSFLSNNCLFKNLIKNFKLYLIFFKPFNNYEINIYQFFIKRLHYVNISYSVTVAQGTSPTSRHLGRCFFLFRNIPDFNITNGKKL